MGTATSILNHLKEIKEKKRDSQKPKIESPLKKDWADIKATTERLKKQERARAYYLKNRERIKEKARNNYYRKREERKKLKERVDINAERLTEKTEKPEESEIKDKKDGIPILFILFALIGTAIIVLILNQRKQQKLTIPPIQKYKEFDIGGGKIIQIPT